MFFNSKCLALQAWSHRTNTVVRLSSAVLAMTAGIGVPRFAQAQIIDLGSFNGSGSGSNGSEPIATVTFDSSGNLYGTTSQGGLSDNGTVWEIANNGGSYGALTTLANFTGYGASGNGSEPNTTVTFDSTGNMYGTAIGGVSASSPGGVIWEMAKGSGNTYGDLIDIAGFDGVTSGASPSGTIVSDSSGNLYGTTILGGSDGGGGTVWELAKGASAITPVASFSVANGENSLSGVVFDSAGDMFGTSNQGGVDNYGTVWEIVKGSGTVTDLVRFTGIGAGGNGFSPGNSGVVLDAAGNVYGTTRYGGTGTYGTVYEIPKTGASYGSLMELGNFSVATGDIPVGATLDSAGDLFGITSFGGALNDGTVWELAAGTNTVTDIADFTGINGLEADASVTIDSAGNVYGTTEGGGEGGNGTVWEIKGVASAGGVGAATAPEPTALAMFMLGIGFAVGLARRRVRRNV